MLTAIRHRCREVVEGEDRGISLTELIVSMGLMTIIGALASVFFVSMDTANSKTVDTVMSTASARNVLQAWTTLLQLADSSTTSGSGSNRFVQITPTSAIFYANINNRATSTSVRTAPWKVSLSLESGQLVERMYKPQSPGTIPGSYPSSASSTQFFGTGISTTGWLFQPYVIGSPPTLSEPNDCAGGAAGLCTDGGAADAILKTVVRVDIAFTAKLSNGPPQSFTSSAGITGGTSS